MAVLGYQYQVLDADAVFSFQVDARLDGEDHAGLSHIFVDRAYVAVFVIFLSDEVAQTDLPVFAVAFFIDVISCLRVDISEADARFDHGLCAKYRFSYDVLDLGLLRICRLAVEGTCHVGAVALPYASHVDQDAFAGL